MRGVLVRSEASLLYATDSFSTPELCAPLFLAIDVRDVFSLLFTGRARLASPWLDLAEDRPRLDRLSRHDVGSTFFPWAFGPFLARQESTPPQRRGSLRRHPPLRYGPQGGASSIVFGPTIAIEAAAVAGSKTARRSDMANIGSFKKVGNEFQGEIVTLSVQTKGVRIVPETSRGADNAPSHRVYVGRADYAE